MADFWKFGSYTYPGSIIQGADRSLPETRLRVGDTLGAVGRYSQGGIHGARRITLSGHLRATDIEAAWDAFCTAHRAGVPQPLYLGRDDRYILAEVTGGRDVDGDNFLFSIPWQVTFEASTPYWMAATESTTTNTTFAVGGTVETPPTLTVPITQATANALITITVSGAGAGQLILQCPSAATTLTINCETRKITNSAGNDATSLVIGGIFPRFLPGANTVNATGASGVTLGTITKRWRDRWY